MAVLVQQLLLLCGSGVRQRHGGGEAAGGANRALLATYPGTVSMR